MILFFILLILTSVLINTRQQIMNEHRYSNMRGNTRSQTFRKLLNSSASVFWFFTKLSHCHTFYFANLTGSVSFRLESASPPRFRLWQLHTARRRRRVRISETNTPEHLSLSLSLSPSLSIPPPLSLSPSLSLSRSISLQTFGHFYARPLRTLDFVSLDFENLVESDPDWFLWACAGGEWSCRGTSCRCSENMWVLQHSCSTFLLFCSALTRLCAPLSSRSLRVFSSYWDFWMWNIQSELWVLWFLLKSAGTSRTSSCWAPPGWSAAARRSRSVFILRTDSTRAGLELLCSFCLWSSRVNKSCDFVSELKFDWRVCSGSDLRAQLSAGKRKSFHDVAGGSYSCTCLQSAESADTHTHTHTHTHTRTVCRNISQKSFICLKSKRSLWFCWFCSNCCEQSEL